MDIVRKKQPQIRKRVLLATLVIMLLLFFVGLMFIKFAGGIDAALSSAVEALETPCTRILAFAETQQDTLQVLIHNQDCIGAAEGK